MIAITRLLAGDHLSELVLASPVFSWWFGAVFAALVAYLVVDLARARSQRFARAVTMAVVVAAILLIRTDLQGPVCDWWEPWDPFWFFCCVLGLC